MWFLNHKTSGTSLRAACVSTVVACCGTAGRSTRFWMQLGAVGCLLLAGSVGFAQDLPDDDLPPPPPQKSPTRATTAPAPRVSTGKATEDGPGVIGNIGFLGMQTFGREDSIAPLEVMPYLLLDENFLFSNMRGFVSTEGRFGGNLGAGFRRLVPHQHAWYGVNAFYDIDETSGKLFHQLGFGVEAAFRSVEVRSNAYLPVGNTDRTLERTAMNAQFVGNQLLFDQRVMRGYALRGVDVEVGYVLPMPKLGEDSALRWYVGGYFFGGNSGGESVNGFQTRAEAQLANTVTTHLQFTKDEEFGSNLMVGLTLDFPWGESHPTSRWRRNTPSPFRFVHRNYNVILNRRDESLTGLAAVNPLTGTAYQVAHVDSQAAGGGNGQADNPWNTLTDAQASGADLIFVHSGSVLNESIVLGENTWLIGDSGSQWLNVAGNQQTLLPSFNSTLTTIETPRITGVSGNAVTLGSGSVISGFTIDQIQGHGIVGDGITNATIRDVTLSRIDGDAIHLNNVGGNLRIDQVSVNEVIGNGLFVNGGSSTLTFNNGSFRDVNLDAIRLQDISEGTVNLFNLFVEQAGQHGLAIQDVDTDVNVVGLEVTETQAAAVMIDGGEETANIRFTGRTHLHDVDGGVRITDSQANVLFNWLDVSTNGSAAGLHVEDTTGAIQLAVLNIDSETGPGAVFRDVTDLTIARGVLSTKNAAAFDAEDTQMNVLFDSISVDGGTTGIRLVNTPGMFVVVGTNGEGGEIKDTDVGVLLDNVGSVYLQYMDFNDNGTAIRSQGADLLALNSLYVLGSNGYAVDSLNDTLVSIRSSDFGNNGATGGGTIRVHADAQGTYRSEFIDLRISDARGTPILVSNSGAAVGSTVNTNFANNLIESTAAGVGGIHVKWNGSTTVDASNNSIGVTGASASAILVEAAATTDRLLGTFTGNIIQIAGNNSHGINVASAQESDLQMWSNSIVMAGTGGTGFRFDNTGITSTWLLSNVINDIGSAGTGMHFVNVADNSRLQFDANQMNMLSSSATVDRGIRFTTIDGTVQLFGYWDNTVVGATEPLFIPAGKSTGAFILNGAFVP